MWREGWAVGQEGLPEASSPGPGTQGEGTPLPRGGAEIRRLLSQGSCLLKTVQVSTWKVKVC